MPPALCKNGMLGAAKGKHAVVLDKRMRVLSAIHGSGAFLGASCSSNVVAFTNGDGHAYLFKNGKYWRRVHVGEDRSKAVAVLPDGFIACYDKCGRFTFDGEKLWEADSGGASSVLVIGREYVYVGDEWGDITIYKLKDGSGVADVYVSKVIWSMASCGDLLAVGTEPELYLYDVSDRESPEELWSADGFDPARGVAFLPGCKYIAVADEYNCELKLLAVDGTVLAEIPYEKRVMDVVWGHDAASVELEDALRIYTFSSLAPRGVRRKAKGR